ncbi:unnamed protein product [Rhizoctonia solani]|uniref:Protein kinase domain-containing protein n=1 Tax=Rhizoctonia solani TaxID=456999 RepID=A0A8H3DS15_9AGAM|nr:unnamed protein product [Rhizoctonia solani]
MSLVVSTFTTYSTVPSWTTEPALERIEPTDDNPITTFVDNTNRYEMPDVPDYYSVEDGATPSKTTTTGEVKEDGDDGTNQIAICEKSLTIMSSGSYSLTANISYDPSPQVHGDIKALNVLVSPDGVAKLTDFGLSTMSESSIAFSATTTSQAGSVRWMAPELLLDESPKSKPSDVYALGMTILEIFTGSMPYSECRRDVSVMGLVQKGAFPTRPMKQFKNDERGDQTWNILVVTRLASMLALDV